MNQIYRGCVASENLFFFKSIIDKLRRLCVNKKNKKICFRKVSLKQERYREVPSLYSSQDAPPVNPLKEDLFDNSLSRSLTSSPFVWSICRKSCFYGKAAGFYNFLHIIFVAYDIKNEQWHPTVCVCVFFKKYYLLVCYWNVSPF